MDEVIFYQINFVQLMVLKQYLADMVFGRFCTPKNDIIVQGAEPPKDQICQASLKWHQVFNSYEKSAHQLLRSHEMTHFCGTWPHMCHLLVEGKTT